MGKDASLNKIQVPQTARYFQLGALSAKTKHIWFVLHGYGQLAEYFIKHFEGISSDETVIIAPEGTSRFYLKGVFERVGASWMTKVDRLDEIEDQRVFLDLLNQKVFSNVSRDQVKLTVLGFSQGVATAWRWMKSSEIKPDNFILWAGSIPEEFTAKWISQFNRIGFHAIFGTQDQYFSKKQIASYKEKLNELHPDLNWYLFEGDHRMDAFVLREVAQKVQRL